MDFLYPILLLPRQDQKVMAQSTPLEWSDIPLQLLVQTQTTSTDERSNTRENRWIWIREMKQGMSRYLVSRAFHRDICPLESINQTWMENKSPVIDLFLVGDSDKKKHTQGFAMQLAKWPTPRRRATMSTRIAKVNVTMRQNNSSTKHLTVMDQVSYLEIVTLDHAFFFVEYVLRNGSKIDNNIHVDAKEASISSAESTSADTNDHQGEFSEPDLAAFLNQLMSDDHELNGYFKLMEDHPL
jgi:hypothetical protein